jgi:hypothetical protein
MHRWLEDFELKHIELRRCIKAFQTTHLAWDAMATKSTVPGHAAFARRQSAVYLALYEDAKSWFMEKGHPQFVTVSDSDFIQSVIDFRQQELGWLNKLARVSNGQGQIVLGHVTNDSLT